MTHLLAVAFVTALSTASVEVPLAGPPPPADALTALEALPGVSRIVVEPGALRVEVLPDGEVRVSEIARVLSEHAPGTRPDRDRLVIGPHTIFEMNAGVCFFCAEKPLGQALMRRPFVRDWSVVDYWTRGRMRFRVETREAAPVEALGGGELLEDVILTARYVGRGEPDLYWPTGGVEWRPDEAAARREATASRRPLLIFPTAGT